MSPINCCLLLLAAVVWSAPVQPSLAGREDTQETRKTYEKMESCLAKRWKEGKDFDRNMKLIDKCVSLSFVNIWTGEHPMRDVGARIKQLTRLTEDESMCSSRGYDILKQNLEHSKGLSHLMKLIKGFIVENAHYCEPIFASFSQRPIDDGVNPNDRESFLKFTSSLLEEVSGMSDERLETFLEEAIETNSTNLRDYIKETFGVKRASVDFKNLMHRTALEVEGHKPHYEGYIDDYQLTRWSIRPDRFTRTILRHLLEPCGDFVKAMDQRRVFQMASLHSIVLQRNFKFVPLKNNKNIYTSVYDLVSFYKDWIRYEACKTYALPDDILKQVQELRKMILGDHEDAHDYPLVKVKLPDSTLVKLDELIE